MTKELFLSELNRRLSDRPDKNDIINFYYEQITDRMENGESEDEIFKDINIDEILLSLNETDSFEKEKAELNIPDPIIYKKDNSSSTVNEPTFEEPKFEESPKTIEKTYNGNNYSGVHGGRKFWYIIWTIATVVFCIASVFVQVACAFIGVAGVAVIVAACFAFTQSTGLALLLIGVALILAAICLVGSYFAKRLRRFMFSKRTEWNDAIYKKLGGTK